MHINWTRSILIEVAKIQWIKKLVLLIVTKFFFIILEENESLPKGYKLIPYQYVFDAKFDGRKKSRIVPGGHRAPDVPENAIYSGVVSIETIRVDFVLAALNNLDVCVADVSSAFLYEKTREKVYAIAGKEFGEHKGKKNAN